MAGIDASWIASAVALVVLLAAAKPFAALAFDRRFRKAFPRLGNHLVSALFLYAGGCVALVVTAPSVAVVTAPVVALGLGAFAWRARPAYGRRAGLPPGSLAALPVDAWTDQAFYEKRFRRHGPVFKASHFARPMVCVVGLDTGLALLRAHDEGALRSPEAAFARYIPCSYIRSMSPENHRRYRPLLQAAISSEVNRRHAPAIRAILLHHLAAMHRERGRRLTPYSREALYEILFLVFFGVQPGSRDQRTLRDLYAVLDLSHRRRVTVWSPPDQRVQQALRDTIALLEPYIESFASGEPARASGLPVSYLEAAWRHGGRAALDEVVLHNLIYLLQVTCTDLNGLFDWILKKLSEHRDWQARLRTAVAEHGFESPQASDLAQRIVRETFRMEQSEHIYRRIVAPIEIGGYRVPAGWLLRICVRESHRTSPAFADPKAFDPDRFTGAHFGPAEYAPFGLGPRRCVGVHTAVTLAGVMTQTLVAAYRWEVLDAGTPEFRGWHWTPGDDFAVALGAATTAGATLTPPAADTSPVRPADTRP